jgi:transposase
LEALVEEARPRLGDPGCQKLLGAIHMLGYVTELLKQKEMTLARLRELLCPATTEKTEKVLQQAGLQAQPEKSSAAGCPPGPAPRGSKRRAPGHGRNGAAAYSGARKVPVAHASLKPGDACPDGCGGKVYPQPPSVLVRIKGQPPLGATIYELGSLRCNLCGNVYTAAAPPEAGEKKYDETAVSMMAVLRYGTGVPWNRSEGLQANLGIPLPAATQCEILTAHAVPLQPALEELTRQAAQGEVVHNDDTSMRVLSLDRDADISPERTGVFTSGLVWIVQQRRIALYFTGCKHAGENLAEALKLRSPELPPIIQMCDALSRNVPKLVETLVANCNAHGRRNFVKVTANFPEPCRYVLESIGEVYGYDAVTREQGMSAEQRLALSLIHTCELNDVNAFDYLTELLRHTGELKQNPSAWMPWNYRDTLARMAAPAAA